MSRFSQEAMDFARLLHHAADCIAYYDRVTSYNDCNNCGKGRKNKCEYLPKPGTMVRINCPLWVEEVTE